MVTRQRIEAVIEQEMNVIRDELETPAFAQRYFELAAELLAEVVLTDDYTEFLAIPAYAGLLKLERSSI